MTVKYNLAVSTSRPWTLFKLLFRWRGSVWKSVTFELVIWLSLYFTIGIIYRKVLTPKQTRHDLIITHQYLNCGIYENIFFTKKNQLTKNIIATKISQT